MIGNPDPADLAYSSPEGLIAYANRGNRYRLCERVGRSKSGPIWSHSHLAGLHPLLGSARYLLSKLYSSLIPLRVYASVLSAPVGSGGGRPCFCSASDHVYHPQPDFCPLARKLRSSTTRRLLHEPPQLGSSREARTTLIILYSRWLGPPTPFTSADLIGALG